MEKYRAMTRADIEDGLRLCRANGWNQLRSDWERLLALNPEGGRVACVDDRVIGTVVTLRYENRFGWIGMMLVDEAFRRRGIGRRLMTEALDHLKDLAAVRLDATPAGELVYRQLGFEGEYRLSRIEGVVREEAFSELKPQGRAMRLEDFEEIALMDREVFGADRRAMLQRAYEGAPEYAWVSEKRGALSGYCFGRHGFRADYLGPVVADDSEVARALVTACLRPQLGKRFYVDAPFNHSEWRGWFDSVGFCEQRTLLRMCRGVNSFPGLPNRHFAILGPEFG